MKLIRLLQNNLGIVLFICLLSYGVYSQGSTQTISLCLALFLMAILKEENVAVCFIAQTFMCDNLMLLSSLSFASLAAGVLIIRCVVMGNKGNIGPKNIPFILLLLVIQVFSIVIYGNTLNNVIRFCVNIFVIFYFANYSKIFQTKNLALIPSVVSITVLIACVLGVGKASIMDDLGVLRFSGIWLDDNFCGMYCILGIISSIYAIWVTRKALFFAIPSILMALYMGALAMSRTFVYVMILVFFLFLLSIFRNKSVSVFSKVVLSALCIVGAMYFFNHIASTIIENRGIVKDSGDFTNGRIDASLESLRVFNMNPLSWFTGIGISNTFNYKMALGIPPKASHNTYVDILVELGLTVIIYVLILIISFFKNFFKNFLYTIPYTALFSFIVLCYMGTLTMGQYSILYIAFGMILNYLKIPINENTLEKYR